MKARSNSGGIKQLFLQHVEKIVLGVAVVIVALLIWSAMGMKPIDSSKAPDKLVADAKTQITRIETSEPPKDPVIPTNYESRIVAALAPVAPTAYSHNSKLDPETQPALVKRPEATVFPIEDLRGTGLVMSVPEMGEAPEWSDASKEKEKSKKGSAKKSQKANI